MAANLQSSRRNTEHHPASDSIVDIPEVRGGGDPLQVGSNGSASKSPWGEGPPGQAGDPRTQGGVHAANPLPDTYL